MPKEVMRRKASDNDYLHRDFHLTLNMGIEYLREKFGDEAVGEYLEQFYEYEFDMSGCDNARCSIIIRRSGD
jgi:hypothetical protein